MRTTAARRQNEPISPASVQPDHGVSPLRGVDGNDPALERLASMLRRALDVPFVAVTIVRSDGERSAARAGELEFLGRFPDPLRNDQRCQTVFDEGRPLYVDNVQGETPFCAFAWVPVVAKGDCVVGVVSLFDTAPRRWYARDRALLEDVAALTAIEAQLRQDLRNEAATDINGLRQAGAALRESESRFRDIAENIREVFWLADESQRLIYVSPAYEEIWGRPRSGVFSSPNNFIEGVHPDDRDAARARLEHKAEGYDHEYRIVRPDGSVRWIHDRAFPVRDAQGRVTRVAGIAEDVTVRRTLQADLELQAQLLAAVQQAVVSTDLTGTVLTWNRFAESLYGWTADEAIGRDFVALVVPDDHALEAAAMFARLRAGETFAGERRIRRKSGEELWVSTSAAPIRNAAGRVTQIVGTATDITEKRRLEAEFRQAQKMEAVGRLAGGVAHDFNNLLTVIKAHSEFIAQEAPEGGQIREDIGEIAKAATRAAGLTRQLLAFSRRQMLEKRVVDPGTIVIELQKMLSRLIGEDIEMTVSPGTGVPIVYADPGQIEQAVMNLVVNARDAMPMGGTLRLETRTVVVEPGATARHDDAKPGTYAAIVVSDDGIGMTSEVRARIFEPFFTTKGKEQGTGLGLATVYGIAKQSGGFVDCTSAPGQGTTFTLCLPATTRVVEPTGTERAVAPLQRGNETILLVEDQIEVRTVTRRILANQGYQVLEAQNGAEALFVLTNHIGRIDLLLTDAVMPVMSGADLVRAVRSRLPDLPVVIISGYTDDEYSWQGTTDANATFLHKPFKAGRLLRAIRGALGGPV